MNQFKHAVDVSEHVVIPEAQYAIALRLEKPRSLRVAPRLLVVLPAVDFDDQTCVMADEINDIATEVNLATKMRSFQREAVTEIPPESALRVGG